MPVINISNDRESRHVLLVAFFFNLIMHCLVLWMHINLPFKTYILDLKPTTKPHWESQGKMMDNRKYLKGTFLITVVFFLNAINMLKN